MTTPYSQLTPDQLLSAITERDEQLKNCMDKLRNTLKESVPKKDYVEQQRQMRVALQDVAYWKDFSDKRTDSDIQQRLNEERDIVDRVWKALGISTLEQAKPYAIDEHVARLKSQLHASQERCKELHDEAAKVNGFRDDLQRKYQTLRDKYYEACSHLESLLTTHKTVLKECLWLIDNVELPGTSKDWNLRLERINPQITSLLEGSKGEIKE